MRISRVTFCAVALTATALLPVTTASAESESTGSVTVTPSVIAPGGVVDLRVSVCSGEAAVGSSDAFVSEAQFAPAADGGLFAEMKIRSDASAREYPIQVKCQDSSGNATGTVTVVRSSATPVAPVHAGGGGTALLASDGAQEEGPGTRHALIGLGLAGIAAVAVAGRSVRRRRQGMK
ncbi:hypothetical protein [Streptomyces sp. NBC_01465]|uniref:hypothetical protein n=1 Tax=Streptomyces sp. NBC_01465 TaxID=2903878 RepID=UPI002E33BFC0|nr:hypothetical protein [Streptomyces sp. NBC_01465]